MWLVLELWQVVQVIAHRKDFLLRAQPEIALLCEFWMVLMLWARSLVRIEHRAILKDVLLVKHWNCSVGFVPSLVHYLGVVVSCWFFRTLA